MRLSALTIMVGVLESTTLSGLSQGYELISFQRIQLSDEYYTEGANFGDLNRDGKPDIVSGPYWYEGPEFQSRHELYPPKPQDRSRYADHFFSWVKDFNADGWNDVFVVGFSQEKYWIGGFEIQESDEATGVLTSNPFRVTHP